MIIKQNFFKEELCEKVFYPFVILLISSFAYSELKYVEILKTQNLPILRIKNIDDFETIISQYSASIVFLQYHPQSSSSTAFVLAENTYFSFDLEGYSTISDYKNGKSENYRSAADYEKSKALGFETSEEYYSNYNEKPQTAGIPTAQEYTRKKEVLDWYSSLDQIRTKTWLCRCLWVTKRTTSRLPPRFLSA